MLFKRFRPRLPFCSATLQVHTTLAKGARTHFFPSPGCTGEEDELRDKLLADLVDVEERLEALLPLTDVRADLHTTCDTAALKQQLLQPLRAVLDTSAGQEGQPSAFGSGASAGNKALLQLLLRWVQQGKCPSWL